MNTEFFWVLFFALGSAAFLHVSLWVGRLLRPSPQQSVEARSPYECGEAVLGSANGVGFSIRFYLLALAFVLFEVEIIFLFLWGLVIEQVHQQELLLFVIGEAFIFVALLGLGLAYLWAKGFLSWSADHTTTTRTIMTRRLTIPTHIYQNLNR
ncbi:MAG: NADH-quinone oxidoreductase subunit A [Bernardetiaceae bacterium]